MSTTTTGPPIQYTTYNPTPTTTPGTTFPTDPSGSIPTHHHHHYTNHYPNVPITVPLAAAVPLTATTTPGQPTTTSSSYYSPYSTAATGLSAGVIGLAPLGVDGSSTTALQFQQQLQLLQQQQQQLRQTNPAPARPPSPPEPAITPYVAQGAVRRLVANELGDVGFGCADTQSLKRLEVEVVAFVQQLFERAHEYANLANRAGTIPSDLLLACTDLGIEPKELYPFARKRRIQSSSASNVTTSTDSKTNLTPVSTTTDVTTPSSGPAVQSSKHFKRKSRISPTKLTFSTSRSSSPDLLPSDDESGPPIIPVTLRGLPPYFPQLPPKHTYLQTPASPPKKAALPSLEKKLKTASLVQESLKNLLLATEDSTGQEDAELLGHIVNWETGLHPRKRWKINGGR